MSLYSTGTLTNVQRDKRDIETGLGSASKAEALSLRKKQESEAWHYLFVHYKKMDEVRNLLEKQYRTFVHKSILYKRENKRIKKEESPTIANMLFVQGKGSETQTFLWQNFVGLYLVKDCSTKDIATISNALMQSFMKISEIDSTRIRFMPNPFDHYATGNTLVRLTSGPLAGFEGYRIRIARDKCLVTSFGGMTIAIGGIHRDSFENMDEYVRLRREQMQERIYQADAVLTPLQSEIDSCFFTLQNQLDILSIAERLNHWIIKAKSLKSIKDFDGATEIALFILEEIGSRYQSIYGTPQIGDFKELDIICHAANQVLKSLLESDDVSEDLKEIIETGQQSLVIRFPFLPIDL